MEHRAACDYNNRMTSERVNALLVDLSCGAERPALEARHGDWLRCASHEEVDQLLQALIDREPPLHDLPADRALELVFALLVQRQIGLLPSQQVVAAATVDRIVTLYRALGRTSDARHHLLCLLAAGRETWELTALTHLLVEDPPVNATVAARPFVILLRRPGRHLSQLFPDLLEGLRHLSVASPILDLANYLTRERIVQPHPAKHRTTHLTGLLDRLLAELEMMEEGPPARDGGEIDPRYQVAESISLVISLCDALALLGDVSSIGKLHRVLRLRHRRLQVEAASALARLGVEEGVERLIELAGEPVARLRVLAYADELGLLDRVDPQYRSPVARAEAELVSWLAEPTTMGIPPSQCERFDSREQFWPGYEEPIWCHLFKYEYRSLDGIYSNIGIVGPLVHSFIADLTDLPPDDIYAAFAGWQAEHDDIYDIDVSQLSEVQRVDVARFERRLRDEGYEAIRPHRLGFFFGDKVLIAAARKSGSEGIAVVDAQHVIWYASVATRRPIGPAEAYCIYKGRKLLRTFNP